MTSSYARLTDSQWDEIKEFFYDDNPYEYRVRDLFDAIRYITRTGVQWRNLPKEFPPFKSVNYYFNKWKKNRKFEWINDRLNRLERERLADKAPSPSLGVIDSQSVRLSPMIGNQRGTDGGKQVNGRKRTILTDTRGRVWRCEVHPANTHDSTAGKDLLQPDLKTQMPRLSKVLGDAPYNREFKLALETEAGVKFEKSERKAGTIGFVVEVKRWVVERSFAWWNFFRRLVKDYERTVESSEMFVYLANIEMILNSMHPMGA